MEETQHSSAGMCTQLAGLPHGTGYWDHKVMDNMDPEVVVELQKVILILFVTSVKVPTHYMIYMGSIQCSLKIKPSIT